MPGEGDMNNVGGGPREWFQSLPIVTQYWFGVTIVLTLAGNFKVVSVMNFVMDWDKITERFEIWRFLTCFCYAGPFKMDTLINIYLLYSFSDRYERGGGYNTGAGGGTADYAFMLMFGAFSCIATKPLLQLLIPVGTIYSKNMVFMVLYVWSKRFPTAQSSIWGFPVKAMYLPFAYAAITLFTGGSYMPLVHGIIMGHFYYFLVDVVPHVYQKEFLFTPQFLIDQFGVGEYRPEYGAAAPAVGRAARPGARHLWSDSGQRLGDNAAARAPAPAAAPAAAAATAAPRATQGGFGSIGGTSEQEQPNSSRGGSRHNWGGSGQKLGSS